MKPLCQALLVLLSACSAEKKEPNVNLAGYPPAFRAGYVDGCDSARLSGVKKKDASRFKNEPQYAAGWRDGYDICGSRNK